MSDYPRDMIGYGATPPHAQWPGGARIALQIVVPYRTPITINAALASPQHVQAPCRVHPCDRSRKTQRSIN